MGRIVVRTFSGYYIDWDEIPKGLKLSVRDVRIGERWELEDVQYWIRQKITYIAESCGIK